MTMSGDSESIRQAAETPTLEPGVDAPEVPESLADSGLSGSFVADLVLKTLFSHGALTGDRLAEMIRLPFVLLDEMILSLQHRHLVEVRGADGHGRRGYTFDLTGAGREQAHDLLSVNRYVGPAPVPLETYSAWIRRQSVQDLRVPRSRILECLEHLVLEPDFIDSLGPAINSGRSILLYGAAGNGKTSIAEAIAEMLGDAIYIPFAVESEGQIIQLYDPVSHRALEEPEEPASSDRWLRPEMQYDPRFVRIERPVVIAGGELTLEQLDLQQDPTAGVFRAPAQMKANGGVFIIDDFGRQRVRPRNLLNRWMIPLDRRSDYLTFSMGHRVEVPFDCLVVFATNLNPGDLVEEAFLRRLHYKVRVRSPGREQYIEIFRRGCGARGIPFDREAVEYVFEQYYGQRGFSPRASHPHAILDQVCDIGVYLDVEPSLSKTMLDRACQGHFLHDGFSRASDSEGSRDASPDSFQEHWRAPDAS